MKVAAGGRCTGKACDKTMPEYAVDVACDSGQADQALASNDEDLAILDAGLPAQRGSSLLPIRNWSTARAA